MGENAPTNVLVDCVVKLEIFIKTKLDLQRVSNK